VHEAVRDRYCPNNDRPGIDPEVLLPATAGSDEGLMIHQRTEFFNTPFRGHHTTAVARPPGRVGPASHFI